MRKYPVPPLSRCLATIQREARYFQSQFRGLLSRDDLMQEGWLIALKVLEHFDSARGAKIETLLTLAIRQHFRRLIKTTLLRALIYTEEQRYRADARLREEFPRVIEHPEDIHEARLITLRLRTLPVEQQRLAWELANSNGRISRVARDNGWSMRNARVRVSALRAALREETQ